MNRISYDEWLEISRHLPVSFAYTMWDMGTAYVTDKVPTAACEFNHDGEPIRFLVNEKFWNKMTAYDRAFVITHECLHAIYRHGERILQYFRNAPVMPDIPTQFKIGNIAGDIIINHSLVDIYGFVRESLSEALDGIIWLDKFDDEFKKNVPYNPSLSSMEHYMDALSKPMNDAVMEFLAEGNPLQGDIGVPNEDPSAPGNGSMPSAVISEVGESSSTKDIESLLGTSDSRTSEESPPGSATGTSLRNIIKRRKVPSAHWSELMRWKTAAGYTEEGVVESWIHDERRFFDLISSDCDISIPSEVEDTSYEEDSRSNIWLFIDVSGSCEQLVQPFTDAWQSIPKEKFAIRLFTFDTQSVEIFPDSKDWFTNGGTSFNAIQRQVAAQLAAGKKYPDMVWVFTDGQAYDAASIANSTIHEGRLDRWFWFLSIDNSENSGAYLHRASDSWSIKRLWDYCSRSDE